MTGKEYRSITVAGRIKTHTASAIDFLIYLSNILPFRVEEGIEISLPDSF